MRLLHVLAGIPALVVLLLATVMAWQACGPATDRALTPNMDVGRARALLLASVPIGTPADTALARLQERRMSCAMSEPPLANLTWPVIRCSTAPSPAETTLKIDVAVRDGAVADIGVEDLGCRSRADVIEPTPKPLDCDMSSQRLLALDAQRRSSVTDLLADVLAQPTPQTQLAR